MRREIIELLDIPQGIECEYKAHKIICKKDTNVLERNVKLSGCDVTLENNRIKLSSNAGNKKEYKQIKSLIAHIKNMFLGLDKKFTYTLEACNVHFPMTLKVESHYLIINNFLGEKVQRKAKILPGVSIEIKGPKIILSSQDKEAAGQTAANMEKATKIKNRDRRIFQDGIFITSKPAGAKQ